MCDIILVRFNSQTNYLSSFHNAIVGNKTISVELQISMLTSARPDYSEQDIDSSKSCDYFMIFPLFAGFCMTFNDSIKTAHLICLS